MECVLRINGLSKKYSDKYAVNNAYMTINKGDIYGFVGQNGSGKTTIIRMITGLINITEGDFELFGVHSASRDIYQARKRIGAIVENPSIYQNMTAKDNLLLQCELLGIKDKSCIDEILITVGLREVINSDKKSKDFSLGMRQRLAIAMCLIGNPEFLILDEPTNGLDPEGVVELRNLLIDLNQQRKITILISSHILSELSKIATKYGIIHHGELIKEVTAQEVNDSVKKYSEFKLDKIDNLEEILTSNGIVDYKIIGNILRIQGTINFSELTILLSKSNISVLDINVVTQTVEDYYLNIVGGKENV